MSDNVDRTEKCEAILIEAMMINGYEPVEALPVMAFMILKAFAKFGTRDTYLLYSKEQIKKFDEMVERGFVD